jgi:hypothetical protein
LKLIQLLLEALPEPPLHQVTQLIDQGVLNLVDQAHTIAFAAHQSSPLQLTELAADVRLRKTCDLD